ncbi:MAG: YXWGXW repeat-containing protein [Candidatus Competibacter sp.]|nr:YXWGXW repeat-containing protein [Candidatus Competibacter sp.]
MRQSNRNGSTLGALLGLLLAGGASFEALSQPAPARRPSTTVQQEEMVIQREHVVVHGPTVRTEPPPLRAEIVTVAPSPQHVWMPGYWTWRDDDWVWQPGYWEARPYAMTEWVPGQWVATTDGWLWKKGYWR